MGARPVGASQIRDLYPNDGYVAFHARRFARILNLLSDHVDSPQTRVLDIGNSRLTDLIAGEFGVRVDNLGLGGEFETPFGQSYWYDLNLTLDETRWREDLPRYDIVVMGEVIEHLHTAPYFVLGFLRTLLVPGGTLVIQTPNAVALHKRLKMLIGRHPYEMLGEDPSNPGHVREYTRDELRREVRRAGYSVLSWAGESTFDYRFLHKGTASTPVRAIGGLAVAIYRFLPPTLRPAQTLVARRPSLDHEGTDPGVAV